MTQDAHTCVRRALGLSFCITAAALLGGCLTYSPQKVSAMSTVDLCELREVQGPNLTEESRRLLQDEVRRRNDDCRNHVAEVAQRRADFMYREVYGKLSP
jgi:hypothetical protein